MTDFDHASQINGRSTLVAVLWSATNAGLTTGLTAIVFAITSHILSPGDFGAVAFSAAIVAMGSAIVPLAFNEALIQRSKVTSAHLDTVFWLGLLMAGLVWICLGILANPIAHAFDIPATSVILPVLGVRLVFDAIGGVPNALILRKMAFKQIAKRTTLAHGLSAILCLALAWSGFAFWALVLSQLVASIIQALFSLWISGWRPAFNLSMTAFRDLRTFGTFSMGRRALDAAKLDQFLLGSVLGAPVLGLYFFAFRLNEMIQQVTAGAISQVFGVSFAALQSDRQKLREIYMKSCFGAAAISFPTFTGLIVTAPDLVPLVFGAQWTDAVFAVQGLAVLALIASIGGMQAALIQAVGQADWWFYYRILVQCVGLVTILALSNLGLNAVIAGLVLRTVLLWPVSIWRTLSIIDCTIPAYFAVMRIPACATAGMIVMLIALRSVVLPDALGLIGSLALIVAGITVYFALLTYLGRDQIGPAWKTIRTARKEHSV